MAYAASGLTALTTGNSFTLWHYSTTDNIATMNTAEYFNNASTQLGVRDMIICSDTATPTMHLAIVLSNASGVVDISDGLSVPETDGD